MPTDFIKILPSIAGHPLAILAYLCALGGWAWYLAQRYKSKNFLKSLELLPKHERAKFCKTIGYSYDDVSLLPQKQRLKLITQRDARLALVATIVAITLIIVSYLVVRAKMSESVGAIQTIERSRDDLQQKLDLHRERELALVSGVASAAGTAEAIGRITQDSEIKSLAEKLNGLLSDFHTRFGDSHSQKVDLALSLARATAANASGKYDETLNLIDGAKAETAAKNAQSAVEQAIVAFQVRADAYLAKVNWEQALENYNRVLDFNPSHSGALVGSANSLFCLKRFPKALERYNDFIEQLRKTKPKLAEPLASALINRGIIHKEMAMLVPALQDYDEAIVILREELNNGRNKLTGLLAMALANRGVGWAIRGKLADSLADFDEAIRLYQSFGDDPRRSSKNLASALINRATVKMRLGEYAQALGDFGKAIQILNELGNARDLVADGTLANALKRVASGGRREVVYKLAEALNSRGEVFQKLGKLHDAHRDLAEAEAIFRRHDLGDSSEIDYGLAVALQNRGTAYADERRVKEATTSFDEAIQIYEQLVTNGWTAITPDLAWSLSARATVQIDDDRPMDAIVDLDRACEIFENLIAAGRKELQTDLAGVLNNRGIAFRKGGRDAEALRDLNECVAIFERASSGSKNSLERLAIALNTRANAQRGLGNSTDASADARRAVDIVRALTNEGREDLLGDLAMFLDTQGLANRAAGKHSEAIRDLTEAVAIYRQAIQEGRPELQHELAESLNNRGLVQMDAEAWSSALVDFADAAKALNEFSRPPHARSTASLYGSTLLNSAKVHQRLGKPDLARKDCLRVIGMDLHTKVADEARLLLSDLPRASR